MCLQQFPKKTRMSGKAAMCSGIEFHAARPVYEKESNERFAKTRGLPLPSSPQPLPKSATV